MYVKQVALFVLFYVSYCYGIGTRIRFFRTTYSKNGFTFYPKVGIKRMITFECPSNVKESYIYINEFSAPRIIQDLVIKNCKTLTIFLRCTKYPWERKNMKSLHISNIETLKIQNTPGFQTLLPPNVIFENIGNIESIPANTFTQINWLTNHARCFLPSYTFHSLHFRNVSINTVLGQAFQMPNNFGNITFTNTRIKRLASSSFVVNHESKGVFLFENSVVDLVEPSAIHVTGQKVVFTRNKFGEISSSGLRAKTTSFFFAYNSVERLLHSQALTVGSHHAVVSSNHFKHLKTRAFSGMSGSAGRLSTYEFSGNNIEFVEDNCLIPSINSYKTILIQITFKKNKFSCECHQSGALLLRMDKKSGDSITNAFYEKVFDRRSENTCTSTCNLPLASAKGKIIQGKCADTVTIASLCAAEMNLKVKTVISTPKSVILPTKLQKIIPSKVTHPSIKNVIVPKTMTINPPKLTPIKNSAALNIPPTKKKTEVKVVATPVKLIPVKNSATLNIPPTKEKAADKVATASPKPVILPTKGTNLQKPTPPKIHPSISAVKNTIILKTVTVTPPKLIPINNSSMLNVPSTEQKTEDKVVTDSPIPTTTFTRPIKLQNSTPSYIIHKTATIIPIKLLPIKNNTSLNISTSFMKTNTTTNLLKSAKLLSNETKPITFLKDTTNLPTSLFLSTNNFSFKVPSSSTETKKDEVEVATISPIFTTILSTSIQTNSSKITNFNIHPVTSIISDKLLTKNNKSFTSVCSVKSSVIICPLQTNNMSADFTTNEETLETSETTSVSPENRRETTFTTLSIVDLHINGYSSSLETSSPISSLSSTSIDFITDEQQLEASDTTSELPTKHETTAATIIPTETLFTEYTASSSSLEVSSKSLSKNTTNNIPIFVTTERELEYNTSSSLPTKQYNLTNTPISVTTSPSTKYKSRESTDNIQLFTSQENDYVAAEYKAQSSNSDEEYIRVTNHKISVETTTSVLRNKIENCSKTYFLPSSLLLLCVSLNFV